MLENGLAKGVNRITSRNQVRLLKIGPKMRNEGDVFKNAGKVRACLLKVLEDEGEVVRVSK